MMGFHWLYEMVLLLMMFPHRMVGLVIFMFGWLVFLHSVFR